MADKTYQLHFRPGLSQFEAERLIAGLLQAGWTIPVSLFDQVVFDSKFQPHLVAAADSSLRHTLDRFELEWLRLPRELRRASLQMLAATAIETARAAIGVMILEGDQAGLMGLDHTLDQAVADLLRRN